MEKNYPYKAKAMKPIDPKGKCSKGGEYQSDWMMSTTKPMDKPSKLGTSGVLMQSLFGGSKPA